MDGGIYTKTIVVTAVANNTNFQSNLMGDRNADSQLNPLEPAGLNVQHLTRDTHSASIAEESAHHWTSEKSHHCLMKQNTIQMKHIWND